MLRLPSLEAILLSLVLGLLAGGLSFYHFPQAVNKLIYDGFQRTLGGNVPDDIVIIGVDEASLRGIGKWPWRRDIHAQLLDILSSAGAKAVALDIMFAERDTPNPAYDALLIDAVRNNGKIVLPVFMSEVKQGGQAVEILPFNELANVAAELAHVHIEIDEDGICRSVFLQEGLGSAYWQHFSIALYKIAYGKSPDPLPGLKSNDNSSGNMAIVRDYLNGIRFSAGPGGFRTISYIDVLDGKFPAHLLKDKIVFIGVMASGLADTLATPVSKGHRHMQGVEVNANIFQALRTNTLIAPLASNKNALISALMVFFGVLLISTVRPATSLLATIIVASLCLLLSYCALYFNSIWITPAASTILITLSYPIWSWRRLDRSMRYLRGEIAAYENESNFLDEKPPVAQIESGLQLLSQWAPVKTWGLTNKPSQSLNNTANAWQYEENNASFSFQNGGLDYSINVEFEKTDTSQRKHLELLDDISKPWQLKDTAVPKRNLDIVAYYINQIKKSQANRRQLRQFIFSCLSNLQDGVVATSPSSRIILINEQARSLLGVEPDVRIDKTFAELLQNVCEQHETFTTNINAVYQEAQSTQFELITQNNQEILVQGIQFELEDAEDRVIIFTLTDITKLKEMERIRAETLSFVSHDLRSPLVSILALIDNSAGAQSTQTIPNIRRYAERALSYTESFLQLARAEADNIAFYECDLHAIIDNAKEYVYEVASKRGTSIIATHCDDDAWVWGNGDLLERMLINLLDNAIKYSNNDSNVNISLAVEANKAHIAIKDHGIGIPEADIPLLFDQFHRGSSDASRAQRGVGLGLRFIAVSLQRHDGDINVESKVGKGSTFTVSLDILDIEEE